MPNFETAVLNIADAISQGKNVTEIQTDFCPQETNLLKEEPSQARLRCLINKICKSRGMEQTIDEELLKPIEETDQSHLLRCFISILEKFSIQRDEIVIFLKATLFTSDESSITEEKVDFKGENVDHSNIMASYNVSAEQPFNNTLSTGDGFKGVKIISENVSSLENISMVSKPTKLDTLL